ncbi:MAG: hypothetical protein JO329_14100 [Planctomycetaceae bacterium]|nr:hypothetical protein [Planctomycetaceae bacterium]
MRWPRLPSLASRIRTAITLPSTADQDGHNIAEHVAEGVGDGRIGAVIEAVFLVMGQDKIKDIGKR